VSFADFTSHPAQRGTIDVLRKDHSESGTIDMHFLYNISCSSNSISIR
jgi:hypothetical protein